MRFRLRTLLIVLAVGPPVIWGGWWAWGRYQDWRDRPSLRQATIKLIVDGPGARPIPAAPVDSLFDPSGPPDKMIQDWREPRP